jgi:hypothetical protein
MEQTSVGVVRLEVVLAALERSYALVLCLKLLLRHVADQTLILKSLDLATVFKRHNPTTGHFHLNGDLIDSPLGHVGLLHHLIGNRHLRLGSHTHLSSSHALLKLSLFFQQRNADISGDGSVLDGLF